MWGSEVQKPSSLLPQTPLPPFPRSLERGRTWCSERGSIRSIVVKSLEIRPADTMPQRSAIAASRSPKCRYLFPAGEDQMPGAPWGRGPCPRPHCSYAAPHWPGCLCALPIPRQRGRIFNYSVPIGGTHPRLSLTAMDQKHLRVVSSRD